MYTFTNYKTKKAFKEAFNSGEKIRVKKDPLAIGGWCYGCGVVNIEGPHYPEHHTWGAIVKMENWVVVRILK
jgi:hypothetical protein